MESEFRVDDEMILGNATQLNQVLLNVCVNAVHAIGKNQGNIRISCHSEEKEKLAQGVIEKLSDVWKKYIHIQVKDNGCGMDKETLRQIFDPFFTTKKGGEGTGLGLALAEQIITSHKGYIYAESKKGEGSTFHIYRYWIQSICHRLCRIFPERIIGSWWQMTMQRYCSC